MYRIVNEVQLNEMKFMREDGIAFCRHKITAYNGNYKLWDYIESVLLLCSSSCVLVNLQKSIWNSLFYSKVFKFIFILYFSVKTGNYYTSKCLYKMGLRYVYSGAKNFEIMHGFVVINIFHELYEVHS